jgi:SAM-dependent methyltransferase
MSAIQESIKIKPTLWGVPLFYEKFDPDQPSFFDHALDEIISNHALQEGQLPGFCNLSGTATYFAVTDSNLRENIIANSSRSINRYRQMVCALSLALFDHPYASLVDITLYINHKNLKVYTAEANSSFFSYLKQYLRPELLFYSEYFGDEYKSGELVNGIPHQDLQATSYGDEAFDIILTTDVFEHIPDALKAEREVVRILKKNGIYCFSVPVGGYYEKDIVLADLDEHGQIRYYAEPQYHGDPVRPEEGILVFRIFSMRELKQRFEDLGCQFQSYRFWSKSLGILGYSNFIQVVKKQDLTELGIEPNDQAVVLSEIYAELAAQRTETEQSRLELHRQIEQEKVSLKAHMEQEKARLSAYFEQEKAGLEAKLKQQEATFQIEKNNLLDQINQLRNWALDMQSRLLRYEQPNPLVRWLGRILGRLR